MHHETHRIAQGIGTAPAASLRADEERNQCEGGGPTRRRVPHLGLSVAAGSARARAIRVEGGAGFGASPKTARRRLRAALGPAGEGCRGVWFFQRSVDLETDRRGNSQRIRDHLSSESPLATSAPRGLVLSGAGASSRPARRSSHRSLETLPVASYKKRRDDLGPIWFVLMKAAFFSFPVVGERGGRRGRRPSCGTTTNTTAFPLWRPSGCRPFANVWDCIFASSRGTSVRSMSPHSSVFFCDVFVARLFCCGTMAAFTKDRIWLNCDRIIPGFTLSGSPAMHQNSIQSSRSGTTSRGIRPIACFVTGGIFDLHSTTARGASAARNTNSGPSSWRPTCRRRPGDNDITYAKHYIFAESAISAQKRCFAAGRNGHSIPPALHRSWVSFSDFPTVSKLAPDGYSIVMRTWDGGRGWDKAQNKLKRRTWPSVVRVRSFDGHTTPWGYWRKLNTPCSCLLRGIRGCKSGA